MNETITLSQCALQRGVSYKVGSGEQSLDSEMAEVVVILEPVKPIIRFSFSHGPPNVFYGRNKFLLLEFGKHIGNIHFTIKVST